MRNISRLARGHRNGMYVGSTPRILEGKYVDHRYDSSVRRLGLPYWWATTNKNEGGECLVVLTMEKV